MADQAPEVVILGADGVTEHVFPAGFDPKRAAQIVRSQSAPPNITGLTKATGIKGPMSSLDRLLSLLPTLGGAAGGVIGGAGGSAFGIGFGGVPGAVAGAATGGAAGEAMRQNARRLLGAGRSVPATPTEAATGIGGEAAIQGLAELAGAGVTSGLSSGARAVYRGYLKPSMAKNMVGKADTIVETALREALPITKAGTTQANTVIKELRGEVDGILKQAPGEVDLHAVAEQVRAFAKRKYNVPGRDPADFEAAMRVADTIDNHPSMVPKPPNAPVDRVNLADANTVKTNLQEGVGTSQYGVPSKAGKATEKVGAREMRLAIEKQAPAVGPINKRESELIDAAGTIARAVARESNKSPLIGVNTLASGAMGAGSYAKDRDPYSAAAWALGTRLALTPAVATRAAIVASRLGNMPNAVPANAARVAAAAVKAVLAEGEPDQ
jgi:hypothetical protein